MSERTEYRKLTDKEILLLEANGCHAESWDLIQVVQNFNPQRLSQVSFFGENWLGAFTGTLEIPNGGTVQTGIHNAILESVTVGNDVYIYKIGARIRRYHIEDRAVIDHVGEMISHPGSSFGNAVEVKAVNENGGRTVKIYDTMNSHAAYLQSAFRHRSLLVERLQDMASVRSSRLAHTLGRVGVGSVIRHTKIIRDVNFGPSCIVDGTSALINGTVMSNQEMPTRIGVNVYARNFIIQEGSVIGFASCLENSFIGQAVKIEKLFSSIDSLAFAGSEFGHGEIASVFAGPFTVSHHKGTLLIACGLSFFNAGSGTNQSNHMYKLGPNSQGMMERGCKTASNVYLRWPKRIGAGTVILGEHVSPCDLHRFPFSFLIEVSQQSMLCPGRNIRTIGILRDMEKWKRRDSRRGSIIRDRLNFTLINPATMQAMAEGADELKHLEQLDHDQEKISLETFFIRRKDLLEGVELYDLLMRSYLGEVFMKALETLFERDSVTAEDVHRSLTGTSAEGRGAWMDAGGMIAPVSRIYRLVDEIESGSITDPEALDRAIDGIFGSYEADELDWCIHRIEQRKYAPLEKFELGDYRGIVRHWIDAERRLHDLRYEDAKKEFCQSAMAGYGAVPGDPDMMEQDFFAVQHTLDENPAIVLLHEKLQQQELLAERALNLLGAVLELQE